MYSLLLGEAASPEEQEAVRRAIASTPGVARLIQLRTMHLGPEELLVAARVELDPNLSADDAARVIDQAQADLRAVVPTARIIYLEPELPSVADPTR
jgi:divalent metal cation (Fe/Co/Zn/Cd) transporter